MGFRSKDPMDLLPGGSHYHYYQKTPLPPFVIELLFSVFCRPLFCVGLVYILYLCLLPAGVAKHGADGVVHSCDGVSSYHDGKLTGLSKFLALPTFQRLAPYTVGVYLVHYGPLVWVAYWYLPPLSCCH